MVSACGDEVGTLIYLILLIAGLAGMGVMALMGFAHFQGHSHSGGANGHVQLDVNAPGTPGHAGGLDTSQAHGGHAHLGHGHTHGSPTTHDHTAHGHTAHSQGHALEAATPLGPAPNVLMQLLPLMSPLNWFSWMVGAGAAGLLARSYAAEPWVAASAVAGAVAFHQGVVKPVWRLVFGFASRPAGNLEGCLLQEVEAITPFDARGEGLVRVVIDGRSEDVLARLTEGDRQGARVRRGDRLVIEDVDPATNRCLVSRA